MTTIDSDSESQDSDDGRRFRFEATRKDDTLRLQSHSKRRSTTEQSKSSNYRSRSGDRGNHNRRDYDKGRQDRDSRKDAGDREKRKSSKERDSRDNKYDVNKSNSKDFRHTTKGSGLKDLKETLVDGDKQRSSNHRESKETVRNSSNSKDHKNSKDSRSRESKNASTRALKDTKIRDGKDPKSERDREAKVPRDSERGGKRPRDISHDRLSGAKHAHRSREKHKSPRDRSDNNREKGKPSEGEKPKDERGRNTTRNRSPRSGGSDNKKMAKRDVHSPSKILEQIGSDSESDLGALDPDVGPVMALDNFEDCREMNLSDFDIISDTEGSSSETEETKAPAKTGPIIKGEILAPHYYGPKITKRVSRRQYERLVRRQAALNTRRLEELYKVNRTENEKGAKLETNSNNSSAVSDFLLGPVPAALGEHRRSLIVNEDDKCEREYSSEDMESEGEYKPDDKHRDKNSQKNINRLKIDQLSSANEYNKDNNKTDKKIYGPSLPPKTQRDFDNVIKSREAVSSSCNFDKSPNILLKISSSDSIPIGNLNKEINESRNVVIGPSLPPRLRQGSESSKELESEEESSVPIIGPSLPPHLQRENSNPVTSRVQDSTANQRSVFGPTLPPNFIPQVKEFGNDKSESDSEDGDGVLGPLPPDHPAAMNDYIQRQLEERANRMKNKLDAKNSVVEKREEWMIELPSAQAANLGLGKRQFRSKAGPDMSDRSSWTDTPADKAKKKEDKLLGKVKTSDPATESQKLAIQERDKAMARMAEKHASKKRKESLLEIHKKKLHKKKKKEEKEAKEAGGKPTRRPFDRDVDLQANRFDEAQKKSILKKAQLLNDRFSRGESKYL